MYYEAQKPREDGKMRTFPKPKFPYAVNVNAEIARLRQHKQTRGVAANAQERLLIATYLRQCQVPTNDGGRSSPPGLSRD